MEVLTLLAHTFSIEFENLKIIWHGILLIEKLFLRALNCAALKFQIRGDLMILMLEEIFLKIKPENF